ncbi:hypothetical protein NDN08_006139 [Rhodosorus marinus]|uniref:Uncharacterized protein n=1 Tax=Rhodosorus marinus TaxID=101924 RepID=A0AAV8UKA7_9RHOD|nr:hypothetical protein NDN08_006139 [Rhodosorus marinus]
MDGSGSAPIQNSAYGAYTNAGGADIHSLTALLENPNGTMNTGDPNLSHDGYHQGSMQDVGVSYSGMDGVNTQGVDRQISKSGGVNTPRTLPAVLAGHMRTQAKPVNEEELCAEVGKVYGELRKPDGTRYTGNLERAVRGSLCSTGMFEKLEDGTWTLREEQTQAYEERLAARAAKQEAEKNNKRRRRAESAKTEEVEGDGTERRKRKYVRKNLSARMKRSEKREAILEMLRTFSENLRKDPSWSSCYSNPFKSFKGNEQADDVWKKLGNDKFVFMLQMWYYLTDVIQHRHLIQEQLAKEKQKNKENAKNASGDKARTEQTVPEQLNSLTTTLSSLDEMIVKVTGRLGTVEGMVGGQQVWSGNRE